MRRDGRSSDTAALEWGKEAQIGELWLWVLNTNREAVALYQRFGFMGHIRTLGQALCRAGLGFQDKAWDSLEAIARTLQEPNSPKGLGDKHE